MSCFKNTLQRLSTPQHTKYSLLLGVITGVRTLGTLTLGNTAPPSSPRTMVTTTAIPTGFPYPTGLSHLHAPRSSFLQCITKRRYSHDVAVFDGIRVGRTGKTSPCTILRGFKAQLPMKNSILGRPACFPAQWTKLPGPAWQMKRATARR